MEQGFFHVTLPHNYFSLVLYSQRILNILTFCPYLNFYQPLVFITYNTLKILNSS